MNSDPPLHLDPFYKNEGNRYQLLMEKLAELFYSSFPGPVQTLSELREIFDIFDKQAHKKKESRETHEF